MPSSVIVAAKQGLVSLLEAHASLSAVQVAYGWPGDDVAEAEVVFTSDARATDVTPSGLRSGRTHYNENGEFDVIVHVVSPDDTADVVETRCLALGEVVLQVVADNRTLGGVSGLNYAVTGAWQLGTRYSPDGIGAVAQLRVPVVYNARLT